MCLYVSINMTKKYQNMTEPFKAYKVCKIIGGKLHSPYMENMILLDENHIFETESSLNAVISYNYNPMCNEGIHSFVSKRAAKRDAADFGCRSDYVVVTIWIDPKDIVGVGSFSESFSICARRVRFDENEVELVNA